MIQAVYYPSPTQIQTVLQQGNLFKKQEQLFSVVDTGVVSLLTVDLDVEPSLPIPAPMVKQLADNVLDYLAENLKKRAEDLASLASSDASPRSRCCPSLSVSRRRAVGELPVGVLDDRGGVAAAQRRDHSRWFWTATAPHSGSAAYTVNGMYRATCSRNHASLIRPVAWLKAR